MPSLTTYALIAVLSLSSLSNLAFAGPLTSPLSRRAHGGINCDGSLVCDQFVGRLSDILIKVNQIYPGTSLSRGQQIACVSDSHRIEIQGSVAVKIQEGEGLCASLGENTANYTLEASTNGQKNSAADVIEDLIYHGCGACGTAPTVRQGNNLALGSISVNYVRSVCEVNVISPCV